VHRGALAHDAVAILAWRVLGDHSAFHTCPVFQRACDRRLALASPFDSLGGEH
jgi:hypothetical protein